MTAFAAGQVVSLSQSAAHTFSKQPQRAIMLLAGLGVQGDAHLGETVQHRSRMAKDPHQPNLRQVHLVAAELFDDLCRQGFLVEPGQLGENITTRGIELRGLPAGTILFLGETAVIKVTGLRNPCAQIDAFQPGLLRAVLDRDEAGQVIRKAGVMAIVKEGGVVRIGDSVRVQVPAGPYRPLQPV